jgi:CDP-diacylglycerol pyrophosphatase
MIRTFALACCATAALPADRNALLHIVQDQCAVNWHDAHSPAPCLAITPAGNGADGGGYALLADRKGGAHLLLIPTRTLTGIESPELQENESPNYFGAAWNAREQLAAAAGHGIPRNAVGLAINPQDGRSQDQLHIHIECLGAKAAAALQEQASLLTDAWRSIRIGSYHYRARRVLGEGLDNVDPFKLAASELPDAREDMGAWTVVVAGWSFPEGPGFVLLAGTRVPGGESLLDPTCAVMEQTSN